MGLEEEVGHDEGKGRTETALLTATGPYQGRGEMGPWTKVSTVGSCCRCRRHGHRCG